MKSAALYQQTQQFSTEVNPHLWVDQYADYLYSYAMSRINDEEAAKDLVQETFLAALEKIKTFEQRSTVKTWLTAILKYKIIDVYRSKAILTSKMNSNQSSRFFQDDGHFNVPDRPQEFNTEQEEKRDNKELDNILNSCMKKLPSLWHTIFTMKFMEMDKTPAICHEHNLTSANYWVIMHRTKLNLRACLQSNWL